MRAASTSFPAPLSPSRRALDAGVAATRSATASAQISAVMSSTDQVTQSNASSRGMC
jgi:hypothetical protein